MSFGWNLKTLRTQAGLTQEELAQKIGSSQKTISSWEVGRTEPTMKDVVSICEALDCSMDKLTGTKPREVGDITFEDIIVKVRDLSIKELDELCNIIKPLAEQKRMIAQIETMKKDQERRLASYEQQLKQLREQIKRGGLK